MKTIENEKELMQYSNCYSETGFWEKIKSVPKHVGRKTMRYVFLLYYTLKADEVSLGNKAIILGALGYLIFPLDFIPDVFPMIGFVDDAGAIAVAYETVKASITPDIERAADEKLNQWFGE